MKKGFIILVAGAVIIIALVLVLLFVPAKTGMDGRSFEPENGGA